MKLFKRQNNDPFGFDEFGNPVGKAFDLGGFDDDRLHGERILLFIAYTDEKVQPQEVVNSVAERNMQMDVVFRKNGWPFSEADLSAFTQLWYLSDMQTYLNSQQVNMVREFNKAGNGVLLWADNEPYYADANLLAQALANTFFSGNKTGDKILTPGHRLAPGKFIEHPLTNGLNSLYEGITICTVAPAEHITILARSHDGQNCMACYENDVQRVVFDTGFTKIMYGNFTRTAGTGRYFRNIAFWLANATRDSTYQLLTTPEKLATISQNKTSAAYGYELKKPALLLYVLYWDGEAELALEIRRPNGQIYSNLQGKDAPLQVEIPNAELGVWTCTITGVKVETPDTPYVLTAVERDSGRVVDVQGEQAKTPATTDSWPCFMMIDCCEAVYPEAQAITEGVVSFVRYLRDHPVKGIGMSLSLNACNTTITSIAPLQPLTQLMEAELRPQGMPQLSQSLNNLMKIIEAQVVPIGKKAIVFIVLAAEPPSDIQQLIGRWQNLMAQDHMNTIVISVNNQVSRSILVQLSKVPLQIVNPGAIKPGFEWSAKVVVEVMQSVSTHGMGQHIHLPQLPPDIEWIR